MATEWWGLGVGPLLVRDDLGLGGFGRLFTFKWPRFFWTAFEFSAAASIAEIASSPTDSEGRVQVEAEVATIGTRVGYPLYLADGRHQLLFGLGVGGTFVTAGEGGARASLSPSINWVWPFHHFMLFGFGLRAVLPLGNDPAGEGYPAQVYLTVDFGLTPGPALARVFSGVVPR
jgi:hypothetical protein